MADGGSTPMPRHMRLSQKKFGVKLMMMMVMETIGIIAFENDDFAHYDDGGNNDFNRKMSK